MKRKNLKKLSLNRETLRLLEEPSLRNAAGAAVANEADILTIFPKSWFRCPVSWQTNCISICLGCTTPIDGCPDPTIA